jgi:hypothetical protein
VVVVMAASSLPPSRGRDGGGGDGAHELRALHLTPCEQVVHYDIRLEKNKVKINLPMTSPIVIVHEDFFCLMLVSINYKIDSDKRT